MAISLVGQARDRSKPGWTPAGGPGSRFLLAAALGLAETEREDGARWIVLGERGELGGRRRIGLQRGTVDDDLQLTLPGDLTPDRVTATVDPARPLLVLAVDGWPTKPYPLTGAAELVVGDHRLALRPGDRAELAPLLTAANLTSAAATPDRDRDGIRAGAGRAAAPGGARGGS